ncbi:hypothetical protein [Streptomyces sp. NPDC050738]|uniref:hypothetical protein n=1 Tax=Streptomyces sp. NPDC050738 TaxID=3154744 RepID=UPI00341890CA
MSDYQDDIMGGLGAHIANVYGKLGAICAALPVPIALPHGIVSNVEVIPAVRRVVELAEEIPLPSDQASQLLTSAIGLLAAIDLFGLLVQGDFHEVRALCAVANLMNADEAEAELLLWLTEQEG